MNDKRIVEYFKNGHQEKAFRKLYQLYPKIEKLIISYGGKKEDALDVFQESLIIVYRNLKKDDFKLTSSFYTYIYSIARYIWKDTNKKKKNQEIETIDIQDTFEEEKRFQIAEKAFLELGKRCKEILVLFYHRGLKLKQIASDLGFASEKTAKNQKYKCLTKAKEIYKDRIKSVLS